VSLALVTAVAPAGETGNWWKRTQTGHINVKGRRWKRGDSLAGLFNLFVQKMHIYPVNIAYRRDR